MKKHFMIIHVLHNRVRAVMFISLAFLLSVLFSPPAHAQKKVKVFLMAGQSNMQGHASGSQLKKMLCAKDEYRLSADPKGCYDSLVSQEDRLFYTISDFYGTHPTYDSVHARTEAQLINQYDLVDARFLFPFDQVQAINFNYSRKDTVRSGPGIWAGPLTTGFGFTNNGDSYGPELMFGNYMARYTNEDIVLLKVAEGGTSLYVQWRSPSMEVRLGVSNEPSNYPLLVQHLNEVRANIGNYIPKYQGQDVETEIAGFVWFQGWNDAVNATYAAGYEQNLTDLIHDLRNDLGIPELPVVIGQTQHTGENGLIVRAAQEAVGNNIGHAASVYTQDLSDYFHFDSGSHLIIGTRIGEAMRELLGLQEISETVPGAPLDLFAVNQPVLNVQLVWKDNSTNEDAFWIERSTNSETGFGVIAEVPANTTSYQDREVSHATTYYYRVRSSNKGGYSPYSGIADATTDSLINGFPQGWSNQDVGTPYIAGRFSYADGQFTVEGNGYMTSTSDNFHYVFQQLGGDGQIIAKLNSMQKAWWDNQGLMMRETLETGSKYAMTLVNANTTITFKGRKGSSGVSTTDNTVASVPVWLKLVRSGDIFTAYRSADGDTWEKTGQDTIAMGNEIYVGMVAFAPHTNKSTSGKWTNVNVSLLPSALMHPASLEANGNLNNGITLRWTDNSENETGFVIERSLDPLLGFKEVAAVAANTTYYQDYALTPGTHYYRVMAFNQNGTSDYTGVEKAHVLEYKNTILYLPRLAGDYDKANAHNNISVTTNKSGIANEEHRHIYTGMTGKQISVELENTWNSLTGTISLKIMPKTKLQSFDFFKSAGLTIGQMRDKLSVVANGLQNTYSVTLDSVTCNHVVLRFDSGLMECYVNGQWFDKVYVGAFNISSFILGEYEGQLWDIQLFNRLLDDQEVTHLSQRCVSGIVPESLPFPAKPQCICGPYTCLWLDEDYDITQEDYRYYLYLQEKSYEVFTFEVGMYKHQDLDKWVMFKQRNGSVSDGNTFLRYTFSHPMKKEDDNTSYWWHENFHSYQVGLYQGGKWLAEASANWAAWYMYKYPQRGVDKVTFDPQLPMLLHYGGYNRIYQWSVLLSYITEFVSDPAFIGRLYNNKLVEGNIINTFYDQLAKEGYDFEDVFVEFAARTAVWDYPDRSVSDAFAARDQVAIEAFENLGYEDFYHRFANVMSAEGTNGEMTAIPDTLKPGVYAWNTYKVDSTAAATYTIRLKGTDANPTGTRFRAMIVKGSGVPYEYYEMPISSSVAFGETETQFQVSTQAGEELYLVVVSMPEENLGNTDIRYNYTYSFEADSSMLKKGKNSLSVSDTDNLTVYPSITNGNLNINFKEYQSVPVDVTIYKPTGEVVLKKTYQNTSHISLYFEGPSGLYIMKVRSINHNKVVKIIKQ